MLIKQTGNKKDILTACLRVISFFAVLCLGEGTIFYIKKGGVLLRPQTHLINRSPLLTY